MAVFVKSHAKSINLSLRFPANDETFIIQFLIEQVSRNRIHHRIHQILNTWIISDITKIGDKRDFIIDSMIIDCFTFVNTSKKKKTLKIISRDLKFFFLIYYYTIT